MKIVFYMMFFIGLVSCQQDPKTSVTKSEMASSTTQSELGNFDEFNKKDDESCDTEEDLLKKIEEKKKEETFKLDDDEGCEVK